MPELAIYLLGAPQMMRDGKAVKIGRRKATALFSYLLLSGRWYSAPSLADGPWTFVASDSTAPVSG